MQGLPPYVVVFGFFAVALGLLTWLARAIRRRGGMSGAPAAYEEAFRAYGHAAYQEIQAEAERLSPAESPDGPRRWPRRAR
ncbi:hypothetical protein NX794_11820 [Streptomyces sp. LP11]|uniref:Secreted protein n=1 Tax=Streptomyces pyxinicus TaxID=2970331 RepID=A0ABT2B0I1_9ACTN|nr:hypothetical protein [Streptomyces sp. LP11]MCS0601891.1 hypothetical protein [Streptomyces sp. LP11]